MRNREKNQVLGLRRPCAPGGARVEVLLSELRRQLGLHDVHDGLPDLVLLLPDRLHLLHLLRHVLDLPGEVLAGGGNVLLDVVPGADLDDHLLGVAQLPGDVHGARERDEDVFSAVALPAPLERFAGLLKPGS